MRLRAYTPFFAGRFCLCFETVGFSAELSKIVFYGHPSSVPRHYGRSTYSTTSALLRPSAASLSFHRHYGGLRSSPAFNSGLHQFWY